MRPDRVYVTLQGVLAAVNRHVTPERWSTAVDLCAAAANAVGIDPAVPAIRSLMRPTLRPGGTAVPSSIKVFAPTLALAGLLPS